VFASVRFFFFFKFPQKRVMWTRVVLQITHSIFALHVDEGAINIQGAAESDAPQTAVLVMSLCLARRQFSSSREIFGVFLQLQTDGNCKYFKILSKYKNSFLILYTRQC
jgi:hypothetical protein